MANLTEFPWRTLAPKVRQFMGERLRGTSPLLDKRLSVLTAVGIGAGCFCLLVVLWWFTAPRRGLAPPTTVTGIELHQMLSTLQTMLADPTLGTRSPDTPTPFTLKEVNVEVHFVVQHSALPTSAPFYRLVPVDTALQTRPEQVQTLTLHLTTPPPTTLGTPGASPTVPQAAEEGSLLKPSPSKKRARP
jgi:hypothetical protein